VLAAKLLGHTGDITRFPDRDHFASYTGTAPVEASSGDVRRHRLNRGGNRQLNTALHLIAVCQIRDPSPGKPSTSASWPRPRPRKRPAGA
jgi:transposase